MYDLLSQRYNLQHLGKLPLAFGLKMAILARQKESEIIMWQKYLAENVHLKKPMSFDDYKKEIKKVSKKKVEKPDRAKFNKLYGDKIIKGEGVS